MLDPRKILRQLSPALLRELFRRHNQLHAADWPGQDDRPQETPSSHLIYEAWRRLPETARQQIHTVLRDVHELADHAGIKVIAETVRSHHPKRAWEFSGCPKHGPFRMRAHRHLEGRGCRKCTFQQLGRERRLSFWDFVERVITVHGAHRYDYELQGFVNLHSKIPIHCAVHGWFHQSVASHLKGHGCPACVQSEGERRVREALRTLGVSFREQMRFKNCRSKRSLPFDFWLLSRIRGDLWGGFAPDGPHFFSPTPPQPRVRAV